jgi:hypothetical protein
MLNFKPYHHVLFEQVKHTKYREISCVYSVKSVEICPQLHISFPAIFDYIRAASASYAICIMQILSTTNQNAELTLE